MANGEVGDAMLDEVSFKLNLIGMSRHVLEQGEGRLNRHREKA